jgi:hypothetical protein
MFSNDYIDTNTSLCKNQIFVDHSVFNETFPAYFRNDTVYNVSIPTTQPNMIMTDGNQTNHFFSPNIPSIYGYSTLYAPNFAKGVWEPFISPTVPQCQMLNGLILQSKIPIQRRTFKIPILSAVMGLLIPHDQFVLLPIRALNDLYM